MPTDPAPRQHLFRRSGRRAAVLLATAALVLTGCSQEEEPTRPDLLGPRLDSAREAVVAAESLQVSLATEKLPSGTTGLLEATGRGDSSPSFEGDVRVSAGGTTVEAQVVSVDDTVYAKLPFTPGFNEVDPADFGAPDPAALMADETGVPSLLSATQDLSAGDRTRDGEDVLTAVDGTVPGSEVKKLVPTADDAGTFEVSYRLTDDDRLRDATVRGPFYGDAGDVTYRLRVTTSDDPVDITAPSGA